MKKITIFLMGICCAVFMWATGNSTYFYNNDGHLLSFNDVDIDSIAFSKVDINGIEQENIVTQIIYAGDSTYRIPLGQIVCVEFTSRTHRNDEYGITIGQEIDLGLPSGTKWAGWNVGASSPEEYGGYYAWSETEEKNYYTHDSYQFYIGEDEDDNTIFAYIGSNISGTHFDVARQKWGGSWRIPTKSEYDELISKCTWTWFQYKEVNGYKVTGSNGSSIFLPAAGLRTGYESFDTEEGSYGYYSSATLYDDFNGISALYLCICTYYRNYYFDYYYNRCNGFSVRPVK